MEQAFAILSGVVLAVGGPPYLIDILKNKTKPQRTTWLIWTAISVISFVSQVQLGAHWSLLFSGVNTAGNLAIFLLSIKYGVGGWKKSDMLAMVIATLGLALAYANHAPMVALVGAITADFSAVWLTLQKTYLAPASETSITWFLIGTSALLGACAVGNWSFSLLLYPLYIAATSYAVLGAQVLSGMSAAKRRKFPKSQKAQA